MNQTLKYKVKLNRKKTIKKRNEVDLNSLIIMFGTYRIKVGNIEKCITKALKIGYQGLDCAPVYQNEKQIGNVITKAKINRNKIWIQSKLWRSVPIKKAVSNLKSSLRNLQTDYLDCWLLHWPGPGRHLAFPPVLIKNNIKIPNPNPKVTSVPKDWKPNDRLLMFQEMNKAIDLGLTKHLGVCNFSPKLLTQLLDFCQKHNLTKPSIVQNEFHPHLFNLKLLTLCQIHNIKFQAYGSLGNGNPSLLQDQLINMLSEKYHKTPAQLLLQWAKQHGSIIIPKSKHVNRIKENYQIISKPFIISKNDMKKLDRLGRSYDNKNTMYAWLKEKDPNDYL